MADDVKDTQAAKKGFDLSNLGTGAWVGISVVALVVGVLIGHFLLGGGAGAALGKTTLSESELDSAVGTYSFNGGTHTVTAREILEQNSSLESQADADGNYAVPPASSVLSYAQSAILLQEAQNRGLEVSDEDLAAYAEENLGSSDYEEIGTSYGLDAAKVEELLRNSALQQKLYDDVVGADADGATMPEAPEAPTEEEVPTTDENGEELSDDALDEARNKFSKKEYADYIIGLAGDEWDSKKQEWKSKDGQYATALSEYKITNKSASYEAADAAYYVAYQVYSTKQSEVQQKWTDYINDLMSGASISISTLMQ